jgi:uncharacterized protein
MRVAAHRGLYRPDDPEQVLIGTRCGACESPFFPPLLIGCAVCGATEDHLAAADLAARGTLHSIATVHRHRGRDIEAPFAVGEIQLDGGPLIRCTMAVGEADVSIGDTVAAQWVVVGQDDDGNDVVEPRFAPADATTEEAA